MRLLLPIRAQGAGRRALTVTGDGLQHRKFIYVEDLPAHILALGEAGKNQTFNLTAYRVTILQIAETGHQATRRSRRARPGPSWRLRRREVSSQHAKDVLG